MLQCLAEHLRGEPPILQRHGGERREARLGAQRFLHAVVDGAAPGRAFDGWQLIAEAVEPAADQLMIDAVRVHPGTALV